MTTPTIRWWSQNHTTTLHATIGNDPWVPFACDEKVDGKLYQVGVLSTHLFTDRQCPACAKAVDQALKRQPHVYLAGPINGLTPAVARALRKPIVEQLEALGLAVVDPMRPGNHIEETQFATGQIVDRDLADIAGCDIVLADLRGIRAAELIPCGTFMEVYEAFKYGKKTVITLANDFHSIWLAHHSTLYVHTLEDALGWLARAAAGEDLRALKADA